MIKNSILIAGLIVTFGALGSPVQAQDDKSAEPLHLAALHDPHSDKEMLLALATARDASGSRMVAVGDHGIVLLSDDLGKTTRQASSVPTQVSLTGVTFVDRKLGWACGHWGTILKTVDGGESWAMVRSDTSVDRPLFSIHFFDSKHGLAVGLWSLVLITSDGGSTWNEVKLPSPPDGSKADRNLLGIFANKDGVAFVAAERGMVLRTQDKGLTWKYLETGYSGSFWSGTILENGTLLAAGLRGSVYRSIDGGSSWQRSDTGSKSSITGIAQIGAEIVAVGLDGVVLRSVDGGKTFNSVQRADRLALTGVFAGSSGKPSAISKRGLINGI